MSCPFDKELLTGFFDGELDGAEKARVESHISSCSECLRDLGEIKSAATLVKQLPRIRAPRVIAESVARETRTSGRVHSMARFRRGLFWATGAAAAVLILLNVTYFLPRWGGEDPTADTVALAPGTSEKAAGFKAEYREALREPKKMPAEEGLARQEQRVELEQKRKTLDADRLAAAKDAAAGERDKAAAKPNEPAPEPLAARVEAKRPVPKAEAPRPSPKPAPAAPPAPRRMVKKGAAAPSDDAANAKLGKAVPEKSVQKNKADEALRPKNANEADFARSKDGKASTAVTEYLVSAADVASVRRSIEAAVRSWGAAPGAKEAEKEIPSAKFRKLQEAVPPAPLELQLTDAQLAALLKNLRGMKQVALGDYRPDAGQQRGGALAAGRRSARSAAPAPAPVAKQKAEGQSKPAATRNRSVQGDAEEAAKGAPVAGAAARPVLRRVIFRFEQVPAAQLKKER